MKRSRTPTWVRSTTGQRQAQQIMRDPSGFREPTPDELQRQAQGLLDLFGEPPERMDEALDIAKRVNALTKEIEHDHRTERDA